MFADERIAKIKELLLDYKRVDTNTLISILPASAATIRRDLERLEQEGFIRRTHGGAVLVEKETSSYNIQAQEDQLRAPIGQIAAAMIKPGDTVFLGAGLTCSHIAKHLKDARDINVVTNNLQSILELMQVEDCRVMVPGGNIVRTPNCASLSGQYALRNISNLYFQKCFFSVRAANLRAGYMVDSEEEAELLRQLMQHSDETILVIDYTKFDQRSLIPLCGLDKISKVISNIQMPEEYKTYYYDHGINVFVSIGDLV